VTAGDYINFSTENINMTDVYSPPFKVKKGLEVRELLWFYKEQKRCNEQKQGDTKLMFNSLIQN
jgi:hypothetical protein